jgi:methylmalonyl-CoA/ethylmalonyl-CoA epimerase
MNFKKVIVDVRVQSLERAVEFYGQVLGLPLIKRGEEWAAFEARGAEIHLVTYTGVTDDVEFLVDDIETEMRELQEKGVEFFKVELPGLQKTNGNVMYFDWGKLVLFKDSEGNSLALVEA